MAAGVLLYLQRRSSAVLPDKRLAAVSKSLTEGLPNLRRAPELKALACMDRLRGLFLLEP